MEIIEGNKLIAEFMGYYNWEDRTYGQYHTSWDWLMPVVEKIESIQDEHHGYFGVHIVSNTCTIQGTNLYLSVDNTDYGYVYFDHVVLDNKPQSTYQAIIRFLTWYNTQII